MTPAELRHLNDALAGRRVHSVTRLSPSARTAFHRMIAIECSLRDSGAIEMSIAGAVGRTVRVLGLESATNEHSVNIRIEGSGLNGVSTCAASITELERALHQRDARLRTATPADDVAESIEALEWT